MLRLSNTLFCVAFSFLVTLSVAADPALEAVISDYEAMEEKYSTPKVEIRGRKVKTGWKDVSPEALAEEAAAKAALLSRLNEIDRDALDEEEKLNLDILKVILNSAVTRAQFDEARLPFTGDWGFHSSITFDVSRERLTDKEGTEYLIQRIEAVPALIDTHIANMKRGLETGFVSYKDPLDTVIEQLEGLASAAPEDSPLYEPFKTLPKSFSEDEKAKYRADAIAAIEPATASFGKALEFLKTEYAPNTREKAGIVDLPDAKAYYRALVAYHTTLPDLTPEEVHKVGKMEVERIRAEMNAIMEEVEFEGSFAEFLHFLRTDEQFYAKTPEELMEKASNLAKDIDYQMPKFFSLLPRLPYGVEPVPASIAPGYTTGRYISGDLKKGQAAAYWVNTYALDQRPLYELPALTAHEAVPGHHHQIALAQELRDVPEFRRDYYATAFGEGWGLYSETLAGEMGLYDDPYERFGKLSYEMWRACRLVADTGMHWYGWSREEAEKCFTENSALAPLNIKTEVTRYIGWPGQALGYKIGEIQIRNLRARAEQALGDDFDIREFHDLVLEKGALPLEILEARVDAWIAEKSGG